MGKELQGRGVCSEAGNNANGVGGEAPERVEIESDGLFEQIVGLHETNGKVKVNGVTAMRLIFAKEFNDNRLIAKYYQEATGDPEQGRLRGSMTEKMATITNAMPSAKVDMTVEERPYKAMTDEEVDAALLAEAETVRKS